MGGESHVDRDANDVHRIATALQNIASRRQPLWTPVTVLTLFLSLAAIGVSLYSGLQTASNDNSQRLAADQQQLLTAVQALTQVPQVDSQIDTTYATDPNARRNLLAAEGLSSEVQADDAAQLIGKLHDQIPASETYEVGVAFANAGSYSVALHYYKLAIQRVTAPEAQIRAAAYRGLGGAYYSLGQIPQAESAIKNAYNTLKEPAFPASEVEASRAQTDLYDISYADGADLCARAKADLADAVLLTKKLNVSSSAYTFDTANEATQKPQVESCK